MSKHSVLRTTLLVAFEVIDESSPTSFTTPITSTLKCGHASA